ncbi:S-layer homology domain-containing protein [Paenibacillus sp. J5C_2022]|uniref:glycosyl hydrolase family 18 protein n=1 Tax=Paenibacillus sp. J5C2022 TaxID=2977129 RepID=UPI0021CEB43E|nr:S-layer homology domain-containing protein [Paenibacillus sp. J5C2022]MCU6709170.1 S-layer homology domain-containing protein [Paenibacillus sp. J5C2022]
MLKKLAAFTIASAIACVTASHAFAYSAQLTPYKDVEEKDYATEAIYSLSALDIINGYPDMTFAPDGSLSREAFIKLIVTAARIDVKTALGDALHDVESDRWSAPYIKAAYEYNWIDFLVNQEDEFHPEQTMTREEVAALFGKLLLEEQPEAYREQWISAQWKSEKTKTAFQDQTELRAGIEPYIYFCVKSGIMQGEPSGFSPKKPLTRKQAATVLYRYIDSVNLDRNLAITGYYAINSYSALSHMPLLSNAAFGWSHMEYDEESGTAALNTTSTEYKIPQGFEEPLASADKAGIAKSLMIYYGDANLKEFVEDKAAQEAFIDSLLATLEDSTYGFTGVNLDFEGLRDATSQTGYLSFIQDLKEQIGDMTLSVTVPPSNYYKGYDLEGIGEAADEVILMAYDFTHSDSKLPSAPLPLVNESVANALQFIPGEKLVLGISKQANQWVTLNGATSLFNPRISDVEGRLAQPDITETVVMPFFLQQISFQDERGSHDILYEDTESIAKKLWLAKHYGLKGVSLWHMGNFTPEDWSRIAQEQNKKATA